MTFQQYMGGNFFWSRAFSTPVFAMAMMVLVGVRLASGRVDFNHDFAPSETWVKAPEKPLRDDISLNGSWQFQPVALPDRFKIGVDPVPDLSTPTAEGWDKTPVKVPSPWDVNSFGDLHETANLKGQGGDFRCYPSYPETWENVKMGWLKRSFTVPAGWKGRRILIHFAAAAGDLQIQVNGKDAGHRFDIFFPFDVDVTDLVNYGASNEILVGVRKGELFDVKGKYGHRTWQGGSFWGQHVVGIWQDVDLVAVPAVRVSDVFVQPLIDQDTLKAEVTLHNDTAAPTQVDVSGTAFPWISLAPKEGVDAPVPEWKLGDAAALNLPASSITIPAHGEQTVVIQQKVGSALKYWIPDEPNLYGLMVSVKSGGQVIDGKYTRFGWRQISFQGSTLLLNGKPFVFKGDSWHFLGIPQMTRRYPWAWFTALHDAHLNAVRLHAQPYPEFYLDVADEMGIFVLDETAIWASDGGPKLDDDTFWKDTTGHIERLILRDRSHPCVLGWSVCNEVRPIVQGVFHNPPGMYDKLLEYYMTWNDLCHKLDPTRPWVSADGDGDGGGKLPTFVVHYGDASTMDNAAKVGKPWGVGEASSAYYSTPDQVAKFFTPKGESNNGPVTEQPAITYDEHAYDSFLGRMEGVAVETYRHLLLQRKYNASYRSVFNVVWYGLQPLPLGLSDTTKPPTLDDGVFFPAFVENKPGVQPERLGPYSTTLNPGYDPSLPLYKTWPLFDAIKDAQADPPVDFPLSDPASSPYITPPAPTVKSAELLAGPDGKLREQLSSIGLSLDDLKPSGTPEVLFIDGANPPEGSALTTVNAVLGAGGTVIVWGVKQDTLSKLNALLPAPIELTDRKSTSLVCPGPDPITNGLKPSVMYFSELSPQVILDGGLGGPLVEKSTVLLEACNTDWTKWNKMAEYAKTALVLRSEREAKPSGAALIEVKQGTGRLLVCNLPAASPLFKGKSLVRRILENVGLPLKPAIDVGGAFLRTGEMIRVMATGRFESTGPNAEKNFVDPSKGGMKDNDEAQNKRWHVLSSDKGNFDLRKAPLDGPGDNAVTYLSFWVSSTRSLDNLLLEPNVPKLDMKFQTGDDATIWLNGKSVAISADATGAGKQASGLPLQQGWNHFVVRLAHGTGPDPFQAQLVCSDADFFNTLTSAMQKP